MGRILFLWMIVFSGFWECFAYGQGRSIPATPRTPSFTYPTEVDSRSLASGGGTVSGGMVADSAGVECDVQYHVPYRHLKGVMPNFDDFKVSIERGNKLKIIRPAYYSTCHRLEFQYSMEDNNIFIEVKRKDETGQNDLTYDEYEACLRDKGVIENNLYQDNHPEATMAGRREESIDIDYHFNFNRSEDIHVYFASPNFSTHGDTRVVHGQNGVYPHRCLSQVENLYEDEPARIYTSPETAARESAYDDCKTGSHARILGALSRLEGSSASNAGEIRSVLDAALIMAKERRASEIYQRLERLSDQFIPGDNGEIGLSEAQANRLSREYRNLSQELDRILITPLKEKVLELIEEHIDATDDDNRERIENEIQRLTQVIGEYAGKNHSHIYNALRKYGLVDTAQSIEEVRLKSSAYSRMYLGRYNRNRGNRLSPGGAEREITTRLQRFDTVLREWKNTYEVGHGNTSVLREQERVKRRASARVQRDFARYQKRERENLKRYCGLNMMGYPRNPSACERFQMERPRRLARALRERQINEAREQKAESDYERYRQIYEANRNDNDFNNDPYFYDDFNMSGGYNPNDPFGFSRQQAAGSMMMMPSLMGPNFQQQMMMQQQMPMGLMGGTTGFSSFGPSSPLHHSGSSFMGPTGLPLPGAGTPQYLSPNNSLMGPNPFITPVPQQGIPPGGVPGLLQGW